jgi:hypothetical protein
MTAAAVSWRRRVEQILQTPLQTLNAVLPVL